MNENLENKFICKYCGRIFNSGRKLSGHIVGKHELKFCDICKNYITVSNYKKHIKVCKENHKSYYCQKCGKLVTKRYGSGIYCSRHCSNSHIHSDETKIKISNSLKNNLGGFASSDYRIKRKNKFLQKLKEYTNNPNKCKICGKILDYNKRNCKVCSKECQKIYMKGRTGGYRLNSGIGKSGYYKGIFCSSTYELVYLIYCLDNNIPIKRFSKCLIYKDKKYYPDFILDNKLIEIKGYKSLNLYKQLEVAKNNGFEVIVKFREDLQNEFNWVKQHYKYKNLTDLYDSYKYFEYTCDFCGSNFKTMRKRLGKHKFCSRSCAGNFRSVVH